MSSAIDLLLQAGLETEVVHQLVLSLLLRHTNLLDRLLPGFGSKVEVDWEPRGCRYDLGATNADERSAMIELKLDAHLDDTQIWDQIAALRASDTLVYLLLGYSRFTARPRLDHKLGSQNPPITFRVLDIHDLRSVLTTLTVAKTEDPTHLRDLIASYGRLLDRVERRTEGFFEQPVKLWGRGPQWGFYFGFYDHCRRHVDSMKGSAISLVPNRRQQFFACTWRWTELTPDIEAFLQLQNDRLCLRIGVDDGVARRAARDSIRARLLPIARDLGLDLQKPARLGHGATMTLGYLDQTQTQLGSKEHWEHFIAIIHRAEQTIDRLVQVATERDTTT